MNLPSRLNSGWVQIGLFWLIMSLALLAPMQFSGSGVPLTGDDAMRMLEAGDLLSGQSWTDTTQYRDNVPFGGPMHWSRLVDAPLAFLMGLFQPLAGAAALDLAAASWPLLMLLALTVVLVALTERLAGEGARLPLLFLAAAALPIYSEFGPGRVDHHNVQVVLGLLTVLLVMRARGSVAWAALAGASAATIVAVAIEGLPTVVGALLAVPLFWVFDPRGSQRPLLAFGASFAGLSALHLVAVTSPSEWFVGRCDALSATYVGVAMLYAVAVFACAAAGGLLPRAWQRFLLLAMFGTVAAGIGLALYPECIRGPYGNLDADLAYILLDPIGEAQPLLPWAFEWPPRLSILLVPLSGLAAIVAAVILDRPKRVDWLVLLAFCFLAFAVMFMQVRGMRFASIIVLPAGAWAVGRAWEHFRARQTQWAAAATLGVCLAFMGAAHWNFASGLGEVLIPKARAESVAELGAPYPACEERANYARLAALPAGRVISYLYMGPSILLNTPHSIVTAGYHRNEAGLRDAIRFFSGDEAGALEIATHRRLDYLVFCRGVSPEYGLAGLPPFEGTKWPWLTRVSPPDEVLQIYAIQLPSGGEEMVPL